MPSIKYHFLQALIVFALATRGLVRRARRPPVRATKPQYFQELTTRLPSRPVLDAEDYLDRPLDRSDDWTDVLIGGTPGNSRALRGDAAADLRVPGHPQARRRSCSQSSGEQPLRFRGDSEAEHQALGVQGRRWFNNSGTSPELSPPHFGQDCAPTPPDAAPIRSRNCPPRDRLSPLPEGGLVVGRNGGGMHMVTIASVQAR